MSDASAEAQRFSNALRERGYSVVDVPLSLLVGRVAAQRPALILCDVDADYALETTARLRDVPGGSNVDVIFIGESGRTLDEMRDAVFHESSGVFTRPVDTYALLRKVEALIGAPRAATAKSSPSVPAPRNTVRVQSTLFGSRAPSVPSSSEGERPGSNPPSPRVSSRPPAPATRPPARSPSSPPSLPAPIPLGFGADPDVMPGPLSRHIPQSEMSPELEQLLARAEQRLSSVSLSVNPSLGRLSPEDEVEAVLPADVLAALDEPLDPEDEDDELGSSGAPGTRTGSNASRTASGTGGGGTALGHAAYGAVGTGIVANAGGPPESTNSRLVPGPAVQPYDAHSREATPPQPVLRRSSIPIGVDIEARQAPPSAPRQSFSMMTAGTSVESWSAGAGPGAEATLQPAPWRESQSALEPAAPELVLKKAPPRAPPDGGFREPGSSAGQVAVTQPPLRRREATDPGRRGDLDSALPGPTHRAPSDGPSSGPSLDIPAALGRGDAVRALARAIRTRYVGALAFEDSAGIRRIVFRDGDFVTAASGIDGESLVAFMVQRGDLSADAALRLARRIPQFGRHAGAALIAHGHLRQDELWTALRAHAEWLIARIIEMPRGGASLERQVPGRLQEEPAVFGGATGAEVLVEIVRRTVSPAEALARLGGPGSLISSGPALALLGECALSDAEASVIRDVTGQRSIGGLLEAEGHADFASVIYALHELGVLELFAREREAPRTPSSAPENPPDDLDEEALRTRIQNRKALVEDGDYFALLGIGRNATNYDVRRAYLELRREFDPGRILTSRTADLKDDVDTILEVIDEAYEILRDQLRRDRYRRALDARPR